MSDTLQTTEYPNDDSQVQQNVKGDHNQAIGQIYGGMVVYVSGGQAIINPSTENQALKSSTIKISDNPYKGLLAFQESDSNIFFGRSRDIQHLWEQFRELQSSTIRLLPIYGPSGSGKSSLARAGLIPTLGNQPLMGREKARVAVLVPGTQPLEALATVLARIANNDVIPVKKIREFTEELEIKNKTDQYDGLQRIANALPEISTIPLIILVDQFEEIYSLCKNETIRDAMISNLLFAASDSSQYVSVILTMRSDFLGETQKYSALNRLFSSQGFLVPTMDADCLREAIIQPAENAGYSLDIATVNLLIEQTEGREGALPLLQFALTRIWEGLRQGIAPSVTLEQVGGVGGALAGEAQRVYDSLIPEEQKIARRVFLGLVQLGEGTRDTRRRVAVNNLVSYKDDPNIVKQVMGRFAEPGVRLLTFSNFGDSERAEVTHEALFANWQMLNQWLDQSRDDLRFQHLLEDATQHWQQNNRPEGNLWRSPDLDLLEQYFYRKGDDITPLQVEFFRTSKKTENNRKRLRKLGVFGLLIGLTIIPSLAIFSIYQMQRSERQRVEQLAATTEVLVPTNPVNALISAIASVGRSQSLLVRLSNEMIPVQVMRSLISSIQTDRETKRLLHSAGIISIAFSPDDHLIVSGGIDQTLRLWNSNTGEQIKFPFKGHKDVVTTVAFSPSGQKIASASLDKSIRLWDVHTGQEIGQQLLAHTEGIKAITFSPDGKLIVSASLDKTIRFWDASTLKQIGQPLIGHENGITSIFFSPDGKQLVSGSYDKTVRLWNTAKREPIGKSLLGHSDAIISVTFSPDGKKIASASNDRTIRFWDVATGKQVGQPLIGHEAGVFSIAFSPDGKQIVSGSEDKKVRLWDIATSKPIGQPLIGHENAVRSILFSTDGKQIASGSMDQTVRLWNISSYSDQEFVNTLYGHNDQVVSLAFSPDGKQIVSGSYDKTIRFWDTSTGQQIEKPLYGHLDKIEAVAFSPDGKQIVSGSLDKTLRIWDVSTHQQIGQTLRGHKQAIISIAFSPNGKQIVSGSYDRTLRLWDATTGQPIGTPLKGHEDEVRSVVFSPDGKLIASSSYDKTIRLWDAITGQPIGNPLKGHEDAIESIAFSPNSKQIVSASFDKKIRLWDVTTGQSIGEPFQGHEKQVRSVKFSPDGSQIVSSSLDGTIKLWNSSSGNLIGTFHGHTGIVHSVTFSPNGKLIASGGGDRTIRLWKVSWEKLLETACQKLRYHSSLILPTTDTAREAKQTCDQYVWK